MKKTYFFLTAMMSVGMMTSCSTSDTGEAPTIEGQPAVLNLNLNAGKVLARSTAAKDNEAAIAGGEAATFDANGVIVGSAQGFSAYSAASKPSITTTTQATQVSVAANASTTTSFATVKSLQDFKNVTTDLSNTATAANSFNSQDGTKLPMYGNQSFTFSGTSANPEVTLYHLAAKVVLNPVQVDFTNTAYASDASFEVKEIFMYNVKTVCNFAYEGSSLVTNTENTSADCAAQTAGATAYLTTGRMEDATKGCTFYVFPNNDKTTPTKIVVKGLFKSGNSTSTVYYPIVINKYQKENTTITKDGTELNEADENDSKILNNTCYTITLKVQGRGTTGPDVDIVPASATITMSVAPWTDYTQTVVVK